MMVVPSTWNFLSRCKSRQKTTEEKFPAMIPSKESEYGTSSLRPTDDLAGFEPGTSVTGIQAESFRKKAMPLGFALLVKSIRQSQVLNICDESASTVPNQYGFTN